LGSSAALGFDGVVGFDCLHDASRLISQSISIKR
jgi:hypothetical protein